MKLIKTKIAHGSITLETGLHIGGSKSSLDIGGLDSPVIKTPLGVPYIPGSSLKGKIRTLLGLRDGKGSAEEDTMLIKQMFGFQGVNENKSKGTAAQNAEISRLIFRDASLDEQQFKSMFTDKHAVLDTDYTVAKWENTMNRFEGKTKKGGLRQIERVPAGAVFNFEIVINIFDVDKEDQIISTLKEGIEMLGKNYLGGSGTRGYGKVSVDYTIE